MCLTKGAAATTLVAVLLATAVPAETIRCMPDIPYYCANIHVGCAGRSKRRTEGFRLVIDGDTVRALFASGAEADMTVRRYGSATVFREVATGNWIRLIADGRYAQRLQAARPPLMARGTCTTNGAKG